MTMPVAIAKRGLKFTKYFFGAWLRDEPRQQIADGDWRSRRG
jgi:hypothetical protein